MGLCRSIRCASAPTSTSTARQPWEEFDWVGGDIRLGDAMFRVDRRNGRCGATNVDPATGRRDLDIPGSLRKAFGHKDLGVYLVARSSAGLTVGDAVELDGPPGMRKPAAQGAVRRRPAATRSSAAVAISFTPRPVVCRWPASPPERDSPTCRPVGDARIAVRRKRRSTRIWRDREPDVRRASRAKGVNAAFWLWLVRLGVGGTLAGAAAVVF